ncbi:unnamed protein product [Arabidopsis halleri]
MLVMLYDQSFSLHLLFFLYAPILLHVTKNLRLLIITFTFFFFFVINNYLYNEYKFDL